MAEVYVICALGPEGGEARRRADEVCDLLIAPIARESGLTVMRSDRDPTPGHITTQILQGILRARVIVADLTGKNPNVFYELAFAQAFGKTVVMLVDSPDNLPFDTRNERVISIGDADAAITLQQGEAAKKALKVAFETVLADGYTPQSLIRDVAGVASLASLAPENPMATELASVKLTVERVEARVARMARPLVPQSWTEERANMRALVDSLVSQGVVSDDELLGLITERTAESFDRWVHVARGRNAGPSNVVRGDVDPDDIPF